MDIKLLRFNNKKFFIKYGDKVYKIFIANNLLDKKYLFLNKSQKDINIKPLYLKKFFNKFIFKIEPFADKFSYNNSVQVFKLVDCLKELHSIEINYCFLKNRLLDQNNFYSADNIWKNFFDKKITQDFKSADVKKIEKTKNILLQKSFNILKQKTTVIHGDLNSKNILVLENKIKLIDWNDARQDNPFLDTAQVVFYAQKNKKTSENILKRYDKTKKFDELLYFIFLNLLWCLLNKKEYKIYKKIVDFWTREIKDFNFLLNVKK